MNSSESSIEVILFYINDDQGQIESILPAFVLNRNISAAEMLNLCVKSISRSMPSAKVILVTNHKTTIHVGIDNLEIIYADDISHENLIIDLHRFRRNYIKSKINELSNLIFTDIDVLINDNLSQVFENDFDFATTIDPASNIHLNERGLPMNGNLMFNFTGGIYFIKCNERVLNFYDYFINQWTNFAMNEDFSNYGAKSSEVKLQFLKWWGELHTLSVIFGLEILTGAINKKTIYEANFLFLPEIKYNFAPKLTNNNGSMRIHLPDLKNVSMIHFRGARKVFMPLVFNKCFED